jgi:hypothetical protein
MKKLLFLFLIVAGCSSDPTTEPIIYEISPKFNTEVQAFYSEAQVRGITIDKVNLIVAELAPEYQDANGVFAGSRFYKVGDQRVIEIRDTPCNEFAVFRELGHVFLSKPYASSGEVIMNPYANPCGWKNSNGTVNPTLRTQYIVQLFGN